MFTTTDIDTMLPQQLAQDAVELLNKLQRRRSKIKKTTAEIYAQQMAEYDRLNLSTNPIWAQNKDFRDLLDSFKKDLSQEESKGLQLLAYRILVSKIVNGVQPIYLNCPLDMASVKAAAIQHGINVTSYPKFTGVKLRIDEIEAQSQRRIKFTALIFKSGKVNCVGIKDNHPEYLQAVKRCFSKYQKLLMPQLKTFEMDTENLVNSVLSIKIPKAIPLNHLTLFNNLPEWRNIKYNSQLFPGAILKCEHSNAKIIFFTTGSSIYTGVSSGTRRKQLLKDFLSVLHAYLKLLKTQKNK